MLFQISKEDENRHIKLWKEYGFNIRDQKYDVNELCTMLGFVEIEEFIYWILKECRRFNEESAHNYIKVGSPHNMLLRTIYNFVKTKHKNEFELNENIFEMRFQEDLSSWNNYLRFQKEQKIARIKESENNERERHEVAVKKKAAAATINLFNAIRRKDIKAIIALRKKGADINIENENNISPLQYATQLGNKQIIDALCQNLDEFDENNV